MAPTQSGFILSTNQSHTLRVMAETNKYNYFERFEWSSQIKNDSEWSEWFIWSFRSFRVFFLQSNLVQSLGKKQWFSPKGSFWFLIHTCLRWCACVLSLIYYKCLVTQATKLRRPYPFPFPVSLSSLSGASNKRTCNFILSGC